MSTEPPDLTGRPRVLEPSQVDTPKTPELAPVPLTAPCLPDQSTGLELSVLGLADKPFTSQTSRPPLASTPLPDLKTTITLLVSKPTPAPPSSGVGPVSLTAPRLTDQSTPPASQGI